VVDTALVTLFSIGLSVAITIPFRHSLGVMNMAQRKKIEVLSAGCTNSLAEERMTNCDPPRAWGAERRAVLAVGLGLGLAPWLSDAASADDPTTIAPQPGDQFAFLTGEKKGQVVTADDLPLGGPRCRLIPSTRRAGSFGVVRG
jgi:hypothetical protein